ncbi:MAG: DegT/DnrJ/EryC1/StrS family aminotransferase [Desulfobacterota bacterium]|nr:DegT/DnrJ/EryC1/StrS family aminotransferase [Thermodesulfobacteriota bacterium]
MNSTESTRTNTGEVMGVYPFNLARDALDIKEELKKIFEEVLDSGEYILGDQLSLFEKEFADFVGVKYAVGVNSGTDALRIAALSLGLERGDRFVTTPNTYIATVMALSVMGLEPVLCDIELETYTMDPNQLEDILRKENGIKLCIPVHLYGHPARMDEITEVCRKYGVFVLEDACQAHGAKYKERKVGSIGDASAFSFYPTKNLGCLGDGGIIVTSSEEVYDKARMLRNYGQKEKHVHLTQGFNSRLDEIQAAFLRKKLPHLEEQNKKRRHIAWLYKKELHDLPLDLPYEADWAYHVYHLFVVRTEKRDELASYLRNSGIHTLIHYPTPIHLQPAYSFLNYRRGDFPNAEKAASQIISLPMYPSLKEDEVLRVCYSIRKFFAQ